MGLDLDPAFSLSGIDLDSHARNLADFIAAKPEHCNFGFEQVSVSVWLIETLDLSRILNFLPSHCN